MPSKKYWNNRYVNEDIGWDIGEISKPIKHWLDTYNNKTKKILIPGSGSGFEVGYAYKKGFKNVYYLDFSKKASERFKSRFPDFPNSQIISSDFFNLKNYTAFFDIILEQTFFCAIEPRRRTEYMNKTYDLLNEHGRIIGLLFNTELNKTSPPFGGSIKIYKSIFKPKFRVLKMEKCINSIDPRANNELWIHLSKKHYENY